MNSGSAAAKLSEMSGVVKSVVTLSSSASDPLAKSYFAQFLIVYISGMFEESIELIFSDFASRHSSQPPLKRYVVGSLGKSFRNPDCSNICDVLGKFDKVWVNSFKSFDSGKKAALDLIITNKNAIAHGNGPCTLTTAEVEIHYKDALEVILFIDSIIV